VTFLSERDALWRSPPIGFSVVAGSEQGLSKLLLIRGTLPPADRGFIHYHDGDEIIRVLRGEITVVVGDERRTCRQGDVAVIPPHTRHGFVVGDAEVLVEVISEQGMRSFIAVEGDGGEPQMSELHRADVPFDRDPPPGRPHTSEEELEDFVRRSTDPL
jgi:quercetin dioxygenase-like cupin family protein